MLGVIFYLASGRLASEQRREMRAKVDVMAATAAAESSAAGMNASSEIMPAPGFLDADLLAATSAHVRAELRGVAVAHHEGEEEDGVDPDDGAWVGAAASDEERALAKAWVDAGNSEATRREAETMAAVAQAARESGMTPEQMASEAARAEEEVRRDKAAARAADAEPPDVAPTDEEDYLGPAPAPEARDALDDDAASHEVRAPAEAPAPEEALDSEEALTPGPEESAEDEEGAPSPAEASAEAPVAGPISDGADVEGIYDDEDDAPEEAPLEYATAA